MRRLGLIVLAVLATGCEDRRSFDDRYNQAQEQVENKARALDNRLEGNEAAERERR